MLHLLSVLKLQLSKKYSSTSPGKLTMRVWKEIAEEMQTVASPAGSKLPQKDFSLIAKTFNAFIEHPSVNN